MGMELSNFNILNESGDTYEIAHPNGKKFTVNKASLSDKAQKLIDKMKGQKQKMDEGGMPVASELPPKDTPEILAQAAAEAAPAPQPTLAPQEMAPPTPAPVAPAAPTDPIYQKEMSMEGALNQQEAALKGIGDAKAAEGAMQSSAIADTEKKINAMPTAEQINQRHAQSDYELKKAYDEKKIDPEHYWKDKSTGQKIAAGIGMLLGGFGAVAGQQNLAAKFIEDAINRDIDAQKAEQGKAMNLWKMNREAMGDELQANLATKNQLYTGLQYKLQQAAANALTPMAKQQAQLAISEIEQKKAENRFKLGLMKGGDVDPAVKVQFLVPPEKQKEVFEEIKRAQDTASVAPQIMEAFDQAAKDLRPLSGGRLKNALPFTDSAYRNKLEGLLMTTVQDLEGTVKQAAMDSIKQNFAPEKWQNDTDVNVKREALDKYLKVKAAAPTAKGFGIDLQQYPTTKHPNTNPIVKKGGVDYQLSADGKYYVPVKR